MDKYTQPDFTSIALITIDTQRDTLDGQPFEIPGTSAALPQMQKLLHLFRLQGRISESVCSFPNRYLRI